MIKKKLLIPLIVVCFCLISITIGVMFAFLPQDGSKKIEGNLQSASTTHNLGTVTYNSISSATYTLSGVYDSSLVNVSVEEFYVDTGPITGFNVIAKVTITSRNNNYEMSVTSSDSISKNGNVYTLTHWETIIGYSSKTITFTVTMEPKTVTVTFNAANAYLSVGHTPMTPIGSGSDRTFTVSVTYGTTLYYEVSPLSGYYFYRITGGSNLTSLSGSFTVTSTSYVVDCRSYATITANTQSSIRGTVTGGGQVQKGNSVTLVATPKTGYEFSHWEDSSGTQVSTSSRFTVTASNSAVLYNDACETYTAYFDASTPSATTTFYAYAYYNSSVGSSSYSRGTKGGSVGFTSSCGSSNTSTSTSSSSATRYARAASGYTFDGWYTSTSWSSRVSTSLSYTSTRTSLYARFSMATVSLTINPNGGTYNGSSSTTTISGGAGNTVTLSTPTRNNYTFGGWTMSGQGILNSNTSFTFGSGSATLTANWSQTMHNYTVYAYYNTSGGSTNYSQGTRGGTVGFTSACGYDSISTTSTSSSMTFYATPAVGYQFVRWESFTPQGGGNWMDWSTENPYTGSRNMLRAIFEVIYYETYIYTNFASSPNTYTNYTSSSEVGGSIRYQDTSTHTSFSSGVVATTGSEVGFTITIVATPSTGYTFGGWYTSSTFTSANRLSTNPTYTHTYDGNPLYAQFSIGRYTLTIDPNGGTYSNSTSTRRVTGYYGTTYTLTTPSRSGYTFSQWLRSGSGTLRGSTFTYGAGDTTLVADWTRVVYTVSAEQDEGYSVTGLENSWVYGVTSSITLVFTPYLGYYFTSFSENVAGTLNVPQTSSASVSGFRYTSSRDADTGAVTITITNMTRNLLFTPTATLTLSVVADNDLVVEKASRTSLSATTAEIVVDYPQDVIPRISLLDNQALNLTNLSGYGICDEVEFSYTFSGNVLSLSLSNLPTGLMVVELTKDVQSIDVNILSNGEGGFVSSTSYIGDNVVCCDVTLIGKTSVIGITIGDSTFSFGTEDSYLVPIDNAHNIYISNNIAKNKLYIYIDFGNYTITNTSFDLTLILASNNS